MQNKFPRYLQTIFLIILVLGFVLLALGGYLGGITTWFGQTSVSGQTWLSERFMAISDFLTAPRDMASLQLRNSELESEVARLQTQIIELQQEVTQTEILSALVDFARTNPENSYKAATVIGRDPSPFLRYVIINVGANEGIVRGMPVVTQQGLVGRVDAVVAEASRVQLITDQNSAVNITLKNSKTDAVMVGSLNGDLSLQMISHDVVVESADVVLTSGLGGDFPPNLLVGQIVNISNIESELFQSASVQPIVDFPRVEYVLVIVNFQPVDITPLLPTPNP
ncbi:MAG TPA: rod shape-determining protein MreC [Anaerolineales bacterium]|nr:rod shape-determining protein MreC [Anaerolineales bacterium]